MLSEDRADELSFSIDMTGFFKNNEYFSPVTDGLTLPGMSVLPAISYQISDRFRAELGAYGIKYFGKDPLSDLYFFGRLQYAITPRFHVVLGNLYGDVNHRLIEPLYPWERRFSASPESGLQFVLDTDHWFTDVWVDWQHYIEYGDPVPEVLTFGTSVSALVTDPGSRFSLKIPLQLLIYHQGGQIDTSSKPMIVLGNLATGLASRLSLDGKWIKSIGLDFYFAGYWDRYANKELRPFDKGWGVYPVFHLDANPLKLMAGYWHAKDFYAFQGEALFGSFNVYNPAEQLSKRDLITFKIAFEKEFIKGVLIGAQVETYTEPFRGETDYSFGIHLRFNNSFRLVKFKKDEF